MIIPYLCLLIAAFIPYILVGYAKFSMKGYDNNNPREFLDKLQQGRAKRAHWAQLNAYEAFPVFAAAVIVSQLSGVDQDQITLCSLLFIISRVIYSILYILDIAFWRSILWFVSFACSITLLILAIIK